jgi:short chain dehydrogenase
VSADVNAFPEPFPPRVSFHKCNVAVWAEVVELFAQTRKLHGKIDVVCANAGLSDREDLLKDDEEEPRWEVLDVNLKGVIMSTYYFHMICYKLILFSCQSRRISFSQEHSSWRSSNPYGFYHVLCSCP